MLFFVFGMNERHLKNFYLMLFHVSLCFFLLLLHIRKILIMLIQSRLIALPFALSVADVLIDSLESCLVALISVSFAIVFYF